MKGGLLFRVAWYSTEAGTAPPLTLFFVLTSHQLNRDLKDIAGVSLGHDLEVVHRVPHAHPEKAARISVISAKEFQQLHPVAGSSAWKNHLRDGGDLHKVVGSGCGVQRLGLQKGILGKGLRDEG